MASWATAPPWTRQPPVAPLGLVDVQQISAGGDGTWRAGRSTTPFGAGAPAPAPGVWTTPPRSRSTAWAMLHAARPSRVVAPLRPARRRQPALLGQQPVRPARQRHHRRLYLPVTVAGPLSVAVQVSAGTEHTCALDGTGDVLGAGASTATASWARAARANSRSPRRPAVIPTSCRHGDRRRRCEHLRPGSSVGSVSCWVTTASASSARAPRHRRPGRPWCWGCATPPRSAAAARRAPRCPVGRVDCWGDGRSGQLGNGRTTNRRGARWR